MDNLVEYLVAIVFIISFLIELFGNKDKKPKNDNKSSKPNDDNIKNQDTKIFSRKYDDYYSENDKYAIKKSYEIEKKKEKRSNVEAKKRNNELIKNKKSIIEEYENFNSTEEKVTKKVVSQKNAGYSEQEVKVFTENINNTKQNLFNRTTLKDFIIAYEILNKPLALRNRCRRTLL